MRVLCHIILLTVLITSCSKGQGDDCITSLGETVIEVRMIDDDFNKVKVDDRIKVYLTQDLSKPKSAVISAPDGLINQITTEVADGELEITNENTCNFVRSYDHEISLNLNLHTLTELRLEAISNVMFLDTVEIDNLTIYNYALSDSEIKLKGKSVLVESQNSSKTFVSGEIADFRANIEEISQVDASELLAEEVILDSHTPFDTYISASKGIYVKIFGKGNVIYDREPTEYKVLAERTGSGNLIKR